MTQWREWMSWRNSSISCIAVSFASVIEKPTDRFVKLSVRSNRVCSTNCWLDNSVSETVPDHPNGSCITISIVKIGVVSIRRITFRWIDSSSLHGSTFRSRSSMLRDHFFCGSRSAVYLFPAATKTVFRAALRRLSGATHFVPHLLIEGSGGPARFLACTGQAAKPFGSQHTEPTPRKPLRFARESGNFFVLRWRGLRASCCDRGELSDFKVGLHIPTLPPAFFRYKDRLPDFPDQ